MTIPAFDLSRLRDLSRVREQLHGGELAGVVEGAAEIRGTLGHPTAKAELHARDVVMSDLRLGSLETHAAWDGGTLTADVDAADVSGGTLHLEARLPAAADAPLEASLQAHAFHFALANVSRVRRLEGTLDADLRVDGLRAHPTLAGSLRLDRGAFAAGSDPRLFRDLGLELAAHGHTIELRRLKVSVGTGTLTAHGSVELDGLHLTAVALDAEADRFPFMATNAQAWVNAGVELRGRRVNDKLEGTLTLSKGHARLPALESQRQLGPTGALEDVEYVDVPAQPAAESAVAGPAKVPPKVELLAHIPGPFRVDSPELHAELRGELEVRATDGEIGIYGHVETTAGEVELLGRSYEIELARASFDGEPDPVVEVRLTREISDATVVIALRGRASAPELELASEPPVYDSSQVLGIVISGDPAHGGVGTPGLDRQLVNALSAVLISRLKGQVVSRLPIDVLKIDTGTGDDTLGSARVEVGRYLRPNVYVSYVHHFGATMTDLHVTNAIEANFEYRFRRQLVIGVRYGDAGVGTIDIAWTHRY